MTLIIERTSRIGSGALSLMCLIIMLCVSTFRGEDSRPRQAARRVDRKDTRREELFNVVFNVLSFPSTVEFYGDIVARFELIEKSERLIESRQLFTTYRL